MRKSPIRHHVRSHRRCGRPVHDYDRGKGSRPNIAKPRLRHFTQRPSAYVVEITYITHPRDVFTVNAPSYPDAIENALMIRLHTEPPLIIDAKMAK
jgi:hypothetical protein